MREIRPLAEDDDVSKACFQAALLFSGKCLLSIWKSESVSRCTQKLPKGNALAYKHMKKDLILLTVKERQMARVMWGGG